MFMNVDLPEPDGPMTATNSPDRDRDRDPGARGRRGPQRVLLVESLRLDQRGHHGSVLTASIAEAVGS